MKKIGTLAKIGSILFVLWGILHIWVPYNGFKEYYEKGNGFDMLIGGKNVPKNEFLLPKNKKTLLALNNLFLNFVTNVGGSGVLSFFVAYLIWEGKNAWLAYYIGLICIGITDIAFLYFMIISGVIKVTFPVILGPLLWILAVIITPFGLD
jgi:hypothetical protein